MARILIDNANERVKGPPWKYIHHEQYLGGSIFLPKFSGAGPFSVTFNGTSIALFGNTNSQVNQSGIVSIDGGPPFRTETFRGLRPEDIVEQWFQSPTLPDTTHTITVSDFVIVALDYIVVTAGNDTPLSGEALIIDDSDPAIVYDGSWTQNSSVLLFPPASRNGEQSEFLPFGNATHGTTTTGASATFKFTGTSVSVYGIVHNPPDLGSLAVQYTIDGFPTEHMYLPTAPRPHFPWFSNTSLVAGEHTLKIEVTDANGWNYILDYILYTPSFGSLGAISSMSPSPGTYGHHGVSRPALIGAICGAVISGLVLVGLLCLIFRKRILRWTALRRPASTDRKGRHFSISRNTRNLTAQSPSRTQIDHGLQPNGQLEVHPLTLPVFTDLSVSVARAPQEAGAANSAADMRSSQGSPIDNAGARIQRLEEIVAGVQRDLQDAHAGSSAVHHQPPPYDADFR